MSYNNNQSNELPRDYDLEGACCPNEAHFRNPRSHGLVYKQRLLNVPQGDSLVLDVISADVDVGQTLKLPPAQLAEIQKHGTPDFLPNDRVQDFVQRDILDQSNFLTLF